MALSLGFGIGPLVAALIAQWAPDPLVLPYLPHIALGVLAFFFVLAGAGDGDAGRRRGPAAAAAEHGAAAARFRRVVVPVAPWVFGSASLAIVVLPAQVSSSRTPASPSPASPRR